MPWTHTAWLTAEELYSISCFSLREWSHVVMYQLHWILTIQISTGQYVQTSAKQWQIRDTVDTTGGVRPLALRSVLAVVGIRGWASFDSNQNRAPRTCNIGHENRIGNLSITEASTLRVLLSILAVYRIPSLMDEAKYPMEIEECCLASPRYWIKRNNRYFDIIFDILTEFLDL